jgi:hypothetical protein
LQDKIVSIYPYYGGALTPHWSLMDRKALKSTTTNSSIRSIGATTHASLGLYFQFKKLFINVNTLWGVSQFQAVEENIQKASQTFEANRSNYSIFKLIPKDNLFRIGLGFGF